MRYLTFFSKQIGQDISKKLKNFRGDHIQKQYFLNNKNPHLMVWKEEATESSTSLSSFKNTLFGLFHFQWPLVKNKKVVVVFSFLIFSIKIPFQRAQTLGFAAKIDWEIIRRKSSEREKFVPL
jgi:hypothetical protein